jgi:hypothetical protein
MIRWREEWPLLLGIGVGVILLLHPGFGHFGFPRGADWDTYLDSAAHLWLDPQAFAYAAWRRPLYPFLLGLLGGPVGYVLAGQILALTSALITVVATGVLGRVLARPWVGGLAAAAAAWHPVVSEGAHWVSPYPLLGACTALALALGVACCRWPRWGLAVGAGLFGGACLALDARGLSIALIALGLVLCSRVGRARRAALLGSALAGVLLFAGADRLLERRVQVELLPLSEQVELQHQLPWKQPDLTEARVLGDDPACAGRMEVPLSLEALASDCSASTRARNYTNQRGRGMMPPLAWLLLLPLALLPAPWGRRSSLASALLFLPPLLYMLLAMSWVPYADRYQASSAPLMAVLAPLALERLAHLLSRLRPAWGRWWQGAAIAAATLLLSLSWPELRPADLLDPSGHARKGKAGGEQSYRFDPRDHLLGWIRDEIGPDDLVVGCSGFRLATALLPDQPPVLHHPPNARYCRQVIQHPPEVEGELWLITHHPTDLPEDRRRRVMEIIRAAGWEEVELPVDPPVPSYSAELKQQLRRWRYVGSRDDADRTP